MIQKRDYNSAYGYFKDRTLRLHRDVLKGEHLLEI
jgi:hypothetical protein